MHVPLIDCAPGLLQAPTSTNEYVSLLHRFMRHFAFTYGGATGRRCEEALDMMYCNAGLFDEPGICDGRVPRIIVGWAKNNSDGQRVPVIQPLYPVRDNMFVCPMLVSTLFGLMFGRLN